MLRGEYENALVFLDEALGIQREIGAKWSLRNSLITLGNVLKSNGDYPVAFERLVEGLELNRDLDDMWMYANIFEAIGGVSTLTGDVNRGLDLIGFAAKIREQINSPLSTAENSELEKALNPAKESLGVEMVDAALTTGHALELDEAIDLALAVDLGKT
jgi:tetratricopeptide (TPR) repeat protein